MKLEEMKRIAGVRYELLTVEKVDNDWAKLKGLYHVKGDRPHIMETAEAEFLAMVANNWNEIAAVLQEVKAVIQREEIGGFGFEGIPDLKKAYEALENK